MLKNKFQHGKVGFWKSFDQFAQLQNFDASIGNHYGEKYIVSSIIHLKEKGVISYVIWFPIPPYDPVPRQEEDV